MRIGIDARMYSSTFTGIGRYVYELTQHLFTKDTGHEWVLFMNDPEFERFEPLNDRVKKVRVNAKHYSWAEQVRFARLIRSEKLDLMHFTHFNAPLLYRGPSVVTIHDLTLSFFPGKKMRSPVHRLAYRLVLGSIVRRSRAVIAVSQHTADDLTRLLRVPASKIRVIYEAVAKEFHSVKNPERLEAVRKTYSLERDFILYTGVWRDHKNLVRLIQAFKALCDDPKFEGNLILTGRKDPAYPEVLDTVKALGLEARVRFLGLVPEDDLIALYTLARLYVLPSLYEGFGLSPLEAMACGTPVAASNVACIPEVCGEGNAVFFDPYEVEAVREALARLWNDQELRAQLSERGLKRVQEFSWETMAEATLRCYNQSP